MIHEDHHHHHEEACEHCHGHEHHEHHGHEHEHEHHHEEGGVKETVVKKYYPPDTAALIFALTNVAPEQWKNRQNIEATGRDGRDLYPRQSIDMDKLTAEQKVTAPPTYPLISAVV